MESDRQTKGTTAMKAPPGMTCTDKYIDTVSKLDPAIASAGCTPLSLTN